MNKKRIIAALFFQFILITACKKDRPAFSPGGLWEGNAYLYHAAILNRSNGTSRLYFQIPGIDTARAVTKVDGTYAMDRGKFLATFPNGTDSLFVESLSTSATTLSGIILSTISGEAIPFDFARQ